MSDYSIRKLNENEFHLLIPLMQDCFGLNFDVAYFKWKFVDNPAGFVVGFIAEAANGEVAAYYGVIPELYSIEGKETTIYQSCDTMTHSRHRRKGLFQKLALHCYDYLKQNDKLFVIGFGGGQSTPGFLKFGWLHIFDVRYYFYPRQFALFKRTPDTRVKQLTDYKPIEALLLKSNAGATIHSHKTLRNFTWRIANPANHYQVLGYQSATGYTSYICYYITTDKIVLFDFYFATQAEGKALLRELKNKLPGSSYKGIISFVQQGSAYATALKQAGFIANPFNKGPLSEKVPFIFYAPQQQLDKYKAPHNWQIGSFDHDAL